MLNKLIEAAITSHSPKHARQFYAALCNVPASDYVTAGHKAGALARAIGLPDFPNPFPRDMEDGRPHQIWAEAFRAGYAGQPLPGPAPVPVVKTEMKDTAVAKHPEAEPVQEPVAAPPAPAKVEVPAKPAKPAAKPRAAKKAAKTPK
jgi:hypothetical protein